MTAFLRFVFLLSLTLYTQSRFNLGQPPVRTVVIDSVTPLFRPLLSAVTSQGQLTILECDYFPNLSSYRACNNGFCYAAAPLTWRFIPSDFLGVSHRVGPQERYIHLCCQQVLNDTSASLPTNANSVFASTTRKPALGASFTYLSDATLWMTKWTADFGLRAEEADKGEIYVAELFRSKSMVSVFILTTSWKLRWSMFCRRREDGAHSE